MKDRQRAETRHETRERIIVDTKLKVVIIGCSGAGALAALRCAWQSELSPDPGREPIALAAAYAAEMLRR